MTLFVQHHRFHSQPHEGEITCPDTMSQSCDDNSGRQLRGSGEIPEDVVKYAA